ncbi:CREB1 family protein [Megaselia abdita]
MDSMVEENGNNSNLGPLNETNTTTNNNATSTNNNPHNMSSNNSTSAGSGTTQTTSVPTAPTNLAQFVHHLNAQSVIQPNQSSVIQTACTPHKGGSVLYVSKPTVIHTTSGNMPIQIKNEQTGIDTNSEESLSDDDSPRRREFTRRPSYNKIFNDISGPDPGQPLQLQEGGAVSNLASGNVIDSNPMVTHEDQSRKREIRLQKNREAARECRRKKKEYIKCLENRVAVLENQNKALIEELKALKELYCAQKND